MPGEPGFIALSIITVLLAAMLVMSASGKLRQQEQVVTVINGTVGVPLPTLAFSIAVLVLQLLTV